MFFLMESRCKVIFENSCRSKATFKTFTIFLNGFLNWAKLDHESVLKLEATKLEETLQDYVLSLKRRVNDGQLSPNSIPDMMTGIFKYLKSNRVKFDRDIVVQLYPDRVKLQGDRAITDDEIRQLLEFSSIRETAIVHILSATASRPDGIVNLKIKDIEEYPDGFTKLVLYSGDFKHETITFLHPEATHALNLYLNYRKEKGDKLTDESHVFATVVKQKNSSNNMTIMSLQSNMRHLFKESGIKKVKQGSRYDLAPFNGFRKRFATKLQLSNKINESAIQCFMDHTGYLSANYRKPTEEELFKEYRKIANELTISQEWKLKQELAESKKENVEEKNKRIEQLESTLAKQEIMLKELMKKI